jgi:transposase
VLARKRREVAFKQALIDKLTHEMAILKRLKFAATSREGRSAEQKSLLEETLDSRPGASWPPRSSSEPPTRAQGQEEAAAQARAAAAAPAAPRVHHEPENTTCACGCQMKRIGEDVAEKLDYEPGVFTVERHIRGKWVCAKCETLTQAPVPAHVIDKGIPTTGLLAQVLVAKFLDHLPLYRQEAIFERAGHLIARSTLAQWVGECGVQLQPLVDAWPELLATACCTPTRRRWPCSSRATARPTRPTSGPTAPPASTRQGGGVRLRRDPQRRARARASWARTRHGQDKAGRARW